MATTRADPGQPKTKGRRPVFAALAAVAALAFSFHAFTIVFDALFASRNPALAARVTDSAEAKVGLWQIASAREADNFARGEIRNFAVSAVLGDPLNAGALRALGYHEDHLGNYDEARRLARLAQDITRRDELNQLLLARLSARDGDVGAAMQHLGTALTTSRRAREEIFALMFPLLRNAEFQDALANQISADNDWSVAFLDRALASPEVDQKDIGRIVLSGRPEEIRPLADAIGPNLLSAVARRGDAEMVGSLFALFMPDREGVLEDASLSARTAQPGLGWLGWSPAIGTASGAELGKTDTGDFGVLAWSNDAQERTAVLRRVLQLPDGRYALTDRREPTGSSQARFDWIIQCHGAGKWNALPMEETNDETRFTIDADCPMQIIELQTGSARGNGGGEVVIDNLAIRRINPAGEDRQSPT